MTLNPVTADRPSSSLACRMLNIDHPTKVATPIRPYSAPLRAFVH